MKRRSDKISKFVALASADERRYAQATGRSRNKLNNESERLGELNAHRHVYAKRVQNMNNINSAHLKDYQNFMQRLDHATRSQQQIVHDCEQHLEIHRQRWLVKRQKLESLERVLERYRHEESVINDRQQQSKQDDISQNMVAYHNDNRD